MQVYSFAQTLLCPNTCNPSLSSMSPNQTLDTLAREKTLRQLGFVTSASIMVVLGTEPVEEPASWVDSLVSLNFVILVISLACFLGLAYQFTVVQEIRKISLPAVGDLPVMVWNLCVRLIYKLNQFIGGLGGLYYIVGYMLLFFALRSIYFGLPYGRLIWVGHFDHD